MTVPPLANVMKPACTAAVQTGQQGAYLFVVTDGSAELRPVTTGPSWQGLTVIEAGIKAGESVVTDGQMRLYPGAKVSAGEKEGAGAERAERTSP